MDLDTVTVSDFKTQFVRDFPYLPEWSAETQYNNGDVVYYSTTSLFYQANQNGAPLGTLPTDNTYWDDYTDDIYNYVLDADITRAFSEAKIKLNQSLFGSDAEITLGYLYLTAHYLVMDIRNGQKGIQSAGQYNVSSRSVGSVSESYSIPKQYQDDPQLAYFAQTGYGQKYLSLIQSCMVGNVISVLGATRP